MQIATRTFVNGNIIYTVVSTVDGEKTVIDKYTVSFAADDLAESLKEIHIFLWENVEGRCDARGFTDSLRKHIAGMGYFSVTEEGMQAPLNSKPKLDMLAMV